MKKYSIWFLLLALLPKASVAQEHHQLTLPRLEQLLSQHVTQVIQDSEGFLWYATEGGGVSRDDGRQMTVFRSDAEHPELLASNDVASIASAGSYIIIGTYHGASLLDKRDYSIRRLTEVDDKRVDDIIVSKENGHWWLTSNKKVYEYADGKLLKTYTLADKYIFRLREDSTGHIWATEWEGDQFRLEGERFVKVVSQWPDSIDFSRIVTDRQGRLLVADGLGKCYALSSAEQESWFSGRILSKGEANTIRNSHHLSARPTAMATDKNGHFWFSTGKDIRCLMNGKEETILPDTKDVSAMVFTKDDTLWLATIFGTVMTYKDGQLRTDEYASNEYSDAVTALEVDSLGRLIIVYDRYVRLYDPIKQTLRQQNIEADGIYRIDLQETEPSKRWSQPQQKVTELMPLWIWWLLAILLLALLALSGYILFLRHQRQRFLAAMKKETAQEQTTQEQSNKTDEWLQQAIGFVENNIANEHYNVEQLSSDMCMSRMTFYRKIQSATGQKPTEFIRTIRLRHAAELLRENRMTITEISYASGFSSVSYFSRCFRTMFGISPTQFLEATS